MPTLIQDEQKYLLQSLQILEDLFSRKLILQKAHPVYSESKENIKLTFLQPYPVPTLHESIEKTEI